MSTTTEPVIKISRSGVKPKPPVEQETASVFMVAGWESSPEFWVKLKEKIQEQVKLVDEEDINEEQAIDNLLAIGVDTEAVIEHIYENPNVFREMSKAHEESLKSS